MIVGIALFGILTASVAAFSVAGDDEVRNADLLDELRAPRDRLDALGR
jgi:hypothetical protein